MELNIKQFVIETGILKITKMILPAFSYMKPGEDKTFDIACFRIVHNGEKIFWLKIIRRKEETDLEHFNPTVPHDNLCEITAGSSGGLAHEICHMVYKNSGDPKRYSTPLTNGHIIPILKKNPEFRNIVDYIDKGTIYDKLIGYLYLADDEELTAKLTGFYLGADLTNNGQIDEDEYIIGLKRIYGDMKVFKMNEDTIHEILKIENEKKIIAKHLAVEIVNSETIRDLMKKICTQGEKFEVNYKDLFSLT